MQTNHTPGPWRVEDDLDILEPCKDRIARVCCEYDDGLAHVASEEDLANARLIAAAPLLLRACQEASHSLWNEDGYYTLLRILDEAVAEAAPKPPKP